MLWARSSGRLVSTARWFVRTSTPPAPGGSPVEPMQKRGRSPAGRGARAEPRGVYDQAAPCLRRQGSAAFCRGHARAATREHAAGSGPGVDPGAASRRGAPAQSSGPPPSRPGLQLPDLPRASAAALHPAHDPRASRSARTEVDAPGTAAELRRRPLRPAQRGGALRGQAQAVAGDRNALREARGQLPGGGGHRRARGLVNRLRAQARP